MTTGARSARTVAGAIKRAGGVRLELSATPRAGGAVVRRAVAVELRRG
jgi:hypothetical protein